MGYRPLLSHQVIDGNIMTSIFMRKQTCNKFDLANSVATCMCELAPVSVPTCPGVGQVVTF